MGIALVATPLIVTQLGALGTAGAAVTADAVQYVQPTGGSNSGYAFTYIPGDGTAKTTQPLSLVSGGDHDQDDCATPTASGAALLSLSALYYNHLVNGVPYTGTPSATSVGAYQGQTGACAVQPLNSIEPNESLVFSVGSNALVSGRLLTEAKLPVRCNDDCDDSVITVTVIERNGTTTVGTQTATFSSGMPSQTTVDTGVIASGFSSVEVRVVGNRDRYTEDDEQSVGIVGPAATFTFIQLAQTIKFTNTPPTNPAVGDTYTVSASATSGLPVTFSVDSSSTAGCAVNPSTGSVTLNSPPGSCVIDANQGGNTRWLPAPQAQQAVTVIQLPQTIKFTNTPPTNPAVGDSYTVSASATSGLPVTFSVDSSSTSGCAVDPSSGIVTLNGPAGSCVIDANQAGNSRWLPAPQVQQQVGVIQLPQTISFSNVPPAAPTVNGTYTVLASATSGLAVTYSVDSGSTSGCAVDPSSGVVTLNGPAGTCVIDANQAGDARWLPAPQAHQQVTVGLASQSVSFSSTPPTDPVIGDTYTANASSTSGLPVTYSIDPSSTSGCTVDPSSGDVTFTGPAGTCVIDAAQGGSTSYSPASSQQTVTVFQVICGQQTINTQSTDGTATSGQINATLTFQDYNGSPAPTDVCKDYKSFTATTNDPQPPGGTQTVEFDSVPLPTAHVVATIVWAVQSLCTPDGSGGLPQCAPTYVSFDHGATWVPETFCTSAQAAGLQWCATSKTYKFVDGGTQITENWDGYGDPFWHNGGG